jgi:hypothetical protein
MEAEPPVPDEVLEALAAGEVGAAEAVLLRARLERDAALSARYRAVVRLEAALRGQEEAPLPLNLVAAVVERLADAGVGVGVGVGVDAASRSRPRPVRRTGARARVAVAAAASVLLGFAAASFRGGPDPVGSLLGGPLPIPLGRFVEGGRVRAPDWATPTRAASAVTGLDVDLLGGPLAGPLGAAALGAGLALAVAGARRRDVGRAT